MDAGHCVQRSCHHDIPRRNIKGSPMAKRWCNYISSEGNCGFLSAKTDDLNQTNIKQSRGRFSHFPRLGKLGTYNLRPYVPTPLWRFKFQKFGHHQARCKTKAKSCPNAKTVPKNTTHGVMPVRSWKTTALKQYHLPPLASISRHRPEGKRLPSPLLISSSS